MPDKHICSLASLLRGLAGMLCLIYISSVSANECLNLLPYDVVEDGLPRLCHSRVSGKRELYSCQDYVSGDNRYRVLYRGGRVAKAVLSLKANGKEVLLSSPTRASSSLSCPLKAPTGVPRYATHRGMGICSDEHDRAVACSIFSYAAPRETLRHSYMVFYPRKASEKLQIQVSNTGKNDNAMVAELAYQIGRSLSKTDCCSERALKYFAYAYRLFPRSETYRHAYQHSRALIVMSALQEY
jgi:hypothetical protein